MQKLVIVVLIVAIGYTTATLTPQKYSNIKVDDVLKNVRLLKRYVQCLLDAPVACTNDGNYLREILPTVIATNCRDCNQHEKNSSLKLIAFLEKYHPDWWNAVDSKYHATQSEFVKSNIAKIKEIQNNEI